MCASAIRQVRPHLLGNASANLSHEYLMHFGRVERWLTWPARHAAPCGTWRFSAKEDLDRWMS